MKRVDFVDTLNRAAARRGSPVAIFYFLKNTMKAKRERALAPTKRGVPPKAACDKREQFNCEMGFAIDEERGT